MPDTVPTETAVAVRYFEEGGNFLAMRMLSDRKYCPKPLCYIVNVEVHMHGIPDGVSFDSNILEIPLFEEVGVPEILGRYGVFDELRVPKRWVKRKEVIAKVRFPIYRDSQEPNWWKFLTNGFKDPWHYREFELESPISGLVLTLREELISSETEHGTYYRHWNVWPVILVPKNEPPVNNATLNFYKEIGCFIKNNYLRFASSRRGGYYKRLSTIISDFDKIDLENIDLMKKVENPRINKYSVRKINENDKDCISAIDSLRGEYDELRDRLPIFNTYIDSL